MSKNHSLNVFFSILSLSILASCGADLASSSSSGSSSSSRSTSSRNSPSSNGNTGNNGNTGSNSGNTGDCDNWMDCGTTNGSFTTGGNGTNGNGGTTSGGGNTGSGGNTTGGTGGNTGSSGNNVPSITGVSLEIANIGNNSLKPSIRVNGSVLVSGIKVELFKGECETGNLYASGIASGNTIVLEPAANDPDLPVGDINFKARVGVQVSGNYLFSACSGVLLTYKAIKWSDVALELVTPVSNDLRPTFKAVGTGLPSGVNLTLATGNTCQTNISASTQVTVVTGGPFYSNLTPTADLSPGTYSFNIKAEVATIGTNKVFICAVKNINHTIAAPPVTDSKSPKISVGKTDSGNQVCATLEAMDRQFCWGNGTSNKLGNGSTSHVYTPRNMVPAVGDIPMVGNEAAYFVSVGAGGNHSCGLTQFGDIYCWGKNNLGQLGTGDNVDIEVPNSNLNWDKRVRPISANMKYKYLSVGFNHSCALTTDNKAVCWGEGQYGKLGDGDSSNNNAPVYVANGVMKFKQISAGHEHTCGIRDSDNINYANQVYCWGYNGYRALGLGDTYTAATLLIPDDLKSASTANVSKLSSDPNQRRSFKFVAAGGNGVYNNTCAISMNDELYCWGYNANGQLGTGDTTNFDRPTKSKLHPSTTVVDTENTIEMVSLGSWHACAIGKKDKKALFCWGYDANGQLGNGATKNGTSIPDKSVFAKDWTQISAGGQTSCAMNIDKEIFCWGYNGHGQVGDGSTTNRQSPVKLTSSALN